MNIPDIKREIFSYLRKDPKLVCYKCNKILIWDKEIKPIYHKSLEKNYIAAFCQSCYYKEVGYPDLFTILVILSVFSFTFLPQLINAISNNL